jgi:hypothetical protein
MEDVPAMTIGPLLLVYHEKRTFKAVTILDL